MENTTIYATFWRRAAAWVIDGVIIFTITMALTRFVPVFFFLRLFYKPIFEASAIRATPGKYLAEISVERSNGEQLSLKDAFIRYISSWLSFGVFGLGYMAALFTKKQQTLHDIFADTIVVNKVYENHNGLFNEWWATMRLLFENTKKIIVKKKDQSDI